MEKIGGAVTIAKGSPKMKLKQLVAATYLMVAGGPFGLEDVVHDAGYLGAIVTLLITPLLWSLPTALMVSELATALPESGGYYAWVRRALGPFWGFQEAWLSLVASIFDLAIYPTLFTAYLSRLVPALGEGFTPTMIALAAIGGCALLNVRGAAVVGTSSIALTLLLLSPFAILIIYAPALPPGPAAPAAEFDLIGGIMVAMWNYMGWDNAATVASEVERPERTYPLAMLATIGLVVLTYIVPIFAVSRSGIAPEEWSTGSWASVAGTLCGPWLETAMVVAGMLTALGTLSALTLSYSRLPAVLAEDGYLPAIFALRHPETGAPWVSILACAIAWGLAVNLGFSRLVALDLLLYGFSLILEFTALVALRIFEPDLPRPYRVPGGMPGAVAAGVAPAFLIGLAIVRNGDESVGGIPALVLGILLVAGGPVVYYKMRPNAEGSRDRPKMAVDGGAVGCDDQIA